MGSCSVSCCCGGARSAWNISWSAPQRFRSGKRCRGRKKVVCPRSSVVARAWDWSAAGRCHSVYLPTRPTGGVLGASGAAYSTRGLGRLRGLGEASASSGVSGARAPSCTRATSPGIAGAYAPPAYSRPIPRQRIGCRPAPDYAFWRRRWGGCSNPLSWTLLAASLASKCMHGGPLPDLRAGTTHSGGSWVPFRAPAWQQPQLSVMGLACSSSQAVADLWGCSGWLDDGRGPQAEQGTHQILLQMCLHPSTTSAQQDGLVVSRDRRGGAGGVASLRFAT